jgi:hypothetical protein
MSNVVRLNYTAAISLGGEQIEVEVPPELMALYVRLAQDTGRSIDEIAEAILAQLIQRTTSDIVKKKLRSKRPIRADDVRVSRLTEEDIKHVLETLTRQNGRKRPARKKPRAKPRPR